MNSRSKTLIFVLLLALQTACQGQFMISKSGSDSWLLLSPQAKAEFLKSLQASVSDDTPSDADNEEALIMIKCDNSTYLLHDNIVESIDDDKRYRDAGSSWKRIYNHLNRMRNSSYTWDDRSAIQAMLGVEVPRGKDWTADLPELKGCWICLSNYPVAISCRGIFKDYLTTSVSAAAPTESKEILAELDIPRCSIILDGNVYAWTRNYIAKRSGQSYSAAMRAPKLAVLHMNLQHSAWHGISEFAAARTIIAVSEGLSDKPELTPAQRLSAFDSYLARRLERLTRTKSR